MANEMYLMKVRILSQKNTIFSVKHVNECRRDHGQVLGTHFYRKILKNRNGIQNLRLFTTQKTSAKFVGSVKK